VGASGGQNREITFSCSLKSTVLRIVGCTSFAPPQAIDHTNRTTGNVKFQQGNAPVHTAKVITEYIKRYNISVDKHLPYNLNLNPIEYM